MFTLPLDIYFEIAALVVSVLCYPFIKDKPLVWFIPYLSLIVFVELIGHFVRHNNSWLYNISVPVEYFFYTFIFYNYYRTEVYKRIAEILLILIPWVAFIHVVFVQGYYQVDPNTIMTNTLIAGSFIMIFLNCLYFIDLLKRDEVTNLLSDPLLWISTGLFFFNLVELPFNLFLNYIIRHMFDTQGKLFISIHAKLNYALYPLVSIGLLCTRRYFRKTSGLLS